MDEEGFPAGSVVKNLPEIQETACNVGNVSSIPGSGKFPREGNGIPLQYSCLANPMDSGVWWATKASQKSWT